MDTLFSITTQIGHLPEGATFTYNGWGSGTVTANDGLTVEATIRWQGREVAKYSGLLPGEGVEV